MATNSTGSNFSCHVWYLEAAKKTHLICYYFVTPIYFLLGLAAHSVCLRAFLHELKKDKGYVYQVYLMASRLCQTVFMSILVVSYYCFANVVSPSTAWFRSCYSCMWFAVKIAPFFGAISFTALMLFSILLCADRCYALWRPFSYRASYAKRNNQLIVFLFIVFSILINLAQLFNFNVEAVTKNSSQYQPVRNSAFKYSLLGYLMYQSRTVQEGIGLFALYLCNGALIWLFRMRNVEAKKALNRTNDMKKRTEAERMLTQLAIAQSLCFTASVTYRTVNAVLISLDPFYLSCYGALHQPLLMAVMNSTDLFDFIFVFALNKRFRNSIRKNLSCSPTASTVVVTAATPIRNG